MLGKARVLLMANPSTVCAIHIQPLILQTDPGCRAINSFKGEA